jgi:hypothetical protein
MTLLIESTGEFSQHDFGEIDVTLLDVSTRRIQSFASRLKYSRYIRVSVVEDQMVESLVRKLHTPSRAGDRRGRIFDLRAGR